MRKAPFVISAAILMSILSGCSGERAVPFHASPINDTAVMSSMLINARKNAKGLIAPQISFSGGNVIISWNDNGSDLFTVSRTDSRGNTTVLRSDDCTASDDGTKLEGEYTYTVSGTLSDGEENGSESVKLRIGFVVENGVLSYYRNGEKVTNEAVGTLMFDADGAYTSGDAELDAIVTPLIAANTKSGMTRLEMFRAMYDYIMDNSDYKSIRFVEEESGWETEYAKEFLKTGLGNCFSYAGATAVMARALGFEAKGIYGSVDQTYEWCDHGWTEVVHNGKTYVCDAEMEGVFSRTRDLGWDLFMKEYGKTVTEYKKWEW